MPKASETVIIEKLLADGWWLYYTKVEETRWLVMLLALQTVFLKNMVNSL